MVELKIQLPENYLEEEVRCDYVISSKMKEVWAVELDLFAEFDRVCKKYGIVYYASSGTALGAVRHGGFIPWDDDIDVMMLRSEYDKLCEVASKEFKHPYFFQTEYTDKGSLRGHAQLRNSNTTGILECEYDKKYKYNQGIFIDIFPMDAVIEDKKLYYKQRKAALKYKKLYLLFSGKYVQSDNAIKSFIKKSIYLVGKILKIDYVKYYKLYEKECGKYNHIKTKQIALLSFSFDSSPKRQRKDFEQIIELDFEFLKIPVPYHYDAALTRVFGDWRKLIQGTSAHGSCIFDANKSYTKYLLE